MLMSASGAKSWVKGQDRYVGEQVHQHVSRSNQQGDRLHDWDVLVAHRVHKKLPEPGEPEHRFGDDNSTNQLGSAQGNDIDDRKAGVRDNVAPHYSAWLEPPKDRTANEGLRGDITNIRAHHP